MTFTSLLPLVEAGHMPKMRQLLEEGCSGTLMSTVPPVTGPAWTTFFTGRNPGSHGILDFFKTTADGRSRRLINSREVAGKTLWTLLSEAGKKLVVVNTPMTFPPTRINGSMITGMLTPNPNSDMTWPSDLYRRLRPELGDYIITVNWQDFRRETAARFVQELMRCNAQRTKYIMRLMDEVDWDFTMATYTGTDRIHHALWHYVDPEERAKLGDAYDPGVMDAINSYFRQLDTNIAGMIEKAGPDTGVFFVSDHGFGPLVRKVNINNWLARCGLLKIRQGRLRCYKVMTGLLRMFNNFMRRVDPSKLRANFAPKAKQRAALANFTFYHVFYGSIDWSRTKAYMASNSEQGIYINLKGREPFGSVDPADYEAVCTEVEEALRALKSDEGEPLLSRVYRNRDLYSGPYTERAPDVIFFLQEGASLAEIQLGGPLFRDISWKTGSGNHRIDGFFLAHGPGIRPVPEFGSELLHVMPTILYYLGVPFPEDLDGKLIHEIFTDGFRAANEPVYKGSAMEGGGGWGDGEDVFSEREEAGLQDRMRRLGYMD